MPRWLWFAPLACLAVAAAGWGFRMGWIAATITETDVIETFAAEYTSTVGAGAKRTDCVARPGTGQGVWITVTCTAPDGRPYRYSADRFGRRLPADAVPKSSEEPRT